MVLSQRMNCQTDIAAIVRAESKASFGVDGCVANGNGNRYEVGLLPVKHFFQFSALFQSLTGQSKVVEHLPVHFLGVDGSGILLLRQIIIKGHPNLCQLLLAFRLLTAL